MLGDISHKLVVTISSRTLFNLDEGNAVYEQEGVDSYAQYQIEHENEILNPGVVFSLVTKLLGLNLNEDLVEVILLSRNSADTGLRIFNSIQHHQMQITRAAFTDEKSPFKYIQAFGAHLFLSANPEDVKQALKAGHAAATILPSAKKNKLRQIIPNYASLSTVMLFYSLMKQNAFIRKRASPPSPLMKTISKQVSFRLAFQRFSRSASSTPVAFSCRRVALLSERLLSLPVKPPTSVSLKLYAPGTFASPKLYSLAVSKKANSSTTLAPLSSSTTIKPTVNPLLPMSLPGMFPRALGTKML